MRHRRVVLAVLAAALVLLATPAHASNDPDYKKQYGIKQINAPSAWAKSKGDGVIIAVVDSGVDRDHPDLKDKLLPGYDFGDNDDNPDDDSQLEDGAGVVVRGHGTHVAGIAAATTDNGVGVAGVAPGSKILPVKVFPSKDGSLNFTAVASGIRFALDQGARVINLSLGTFETGVPLVGFTQTPCSEALQRGALCVVASGNAGGGRPSGYPNDYPGLMVTANDKDGKHSEFGQKADTQWALSAPGVGIWSTVPLEDGSYASKQGTSMAAPHAAGVAALAFAQMKPPATAAGAQQVIERLLTTTKPMEDRGTNGAGRIDAAGAVGAPIVAEQEESRASTATTSPIPQTYNDKLRQQQGDAPASPPAEAAASTPAAPAGGEAPAPGAATNDSSVARTEGIRLASGPVEGEESTTTEGTKATLVALGAVGVLTTGGWSGSLLSRQRSSRKLKAF